MSTIPDEIGRTLDPAGRAWRGVFGLKIGESGQRAIRAGLWSGAGFLSSQVLRTGSKLLLTWWLTPGIFGVWVVLNGFLAGLQMFADLGVGPAVVQNKRGEEEPVLRTAFTLQAVRGALLWLVACAIAVPVARAYDEPALAYLLPVIALVAMIGGFGSISTWVLTRRVQIRPLTILNIRAEIVGVAVSLGWAWFSPTIWSLVAGSLATALALAVGSHRLLPRRDGFGWESGAARALLAFGMGALLSSATWFLAGQGERLLLAGYVTMEQLGVYGVALFLGMAVSSAAAQVIKQVLFPSIASSLRESRDKAERQYTKVRWISMAITASVTAGLVLLGPWVTRLLLDPRYHAGPGVTVGVGVILQILSIRIAFETAQSLPNMLLMAEAKLRYAVYANCVRIAMMFVGVPLVFVYGGFEAALWVLAGLAVPTYVVFIVGMSRHFPRMVRGELLYLAVVCGLGGLAAVYIHGYP